MTPFNFHWSTTGCQDKNGKWLPRSDRSMSIVLREWPYLFMFEEKRGLEKSEVYFTLHELENMVKQAEKIINECAIKKKPAKKKGKK